MTPPAWVFLAPGNIPSPGPYPAVWGDCGLSKCRSLQKDGQTQGQKEGLVFPERSQDSLIVPNQATLPLVFKALRRGLGPRTAGGGRKSRDSGLRSGAKSVTVGSGHTGARGSPGGLLGGEAETTPSHFPDVISWEESELAALEPREIPRPQLRSIVRRGGWSLTACQDQAAVNHSPRTAESLGRPLKCPRSLPHVGSLV